MLQVINTTWTLWSVGFEIKSLEKNVQGLICELITFSGILVNCFVKLHGVSGRVHNKEAEQFKLIKVVLTRTMNDSLSYMHSFPYRVAFVPHNLCWTRFSMQIYKFSRGTVTYLIIQSTANMNWYVKGLEAFPHWDKPNDACIFQLQSCFQLQK